MALRSPLLAGDSRLEQAASGGPSVKSLPAVEPIETIRRLQMALRQLSYVFFHSFSDELPDGIFGPDTHAVVVDFQRANFQGQPHQWDGRVGKNTLAKLDATLLYFGVGPDIPVVSRFEFEPMRGPAHKPGPKPNPRPVPKPRLGAKLIKVDTDAQSLQAFVGDRLVYDWDCVSGDSDHPTDPGTHHILRKEHPCRSKTYDVQMNYAQFFTKDGKAIHQYHGITPLGLLRVLKQGSDWFGSHGCVRLTKPHAETLYAWTPSAGTTIKVVPPKKK